MSILVQNIQICLYIDVDIMESLLFQARAIMEAGEK